ncbi:MAG: adenosyl-hopene transferase HpnH [Woeseia sp.]
MSVPWVQKYRVARYIIGRKFRGVSRYPLVLMLEPLFQCNLACAGCGKIDYPNAILRKRMSVTDAVLAVRQSGAPIVSIAGGEPLVHKEMPAMVDAITALRRFVYLCTNAVLLPRKMEDYRPSRYLTFSIHLDGNRERHDASVCQPGVYDKAIAAIELALEHGFRVTINYTLFQGEQAHEIADFLDQVTAMGVEGITMSPGFSYDHAPRQDVFLSRQRSKRLFRELFSLGKRRQQKWPLNHSPLYLDFLAGNQRYQCTPWSNPTYNNFGWQRPCYLLVDEGYAASFQELMKDTPWDNYGFGRNKKCQNCMAHCGYEGTAVDDTFSRPLNALRVSLRGPRTIGPMVPELPVLYGDDTDDKVEHRIPVDQLSVRSASAMD